MSSSSSDSQTVDVTSWLKKDRLEKKIEELENRSEPQKSLQDLIIPSAPVSTEPRARPFEEFERFLESLVIDQLKKPEDLLKLNPSRRESIGRFLTELSKTTEPLDPQEALKQFVRINRSEAEHEALKQLFKQIALVQIGKALLLKSWSAKDRSLLSRTDLKDLTAAIERTLRPFIHLQTSTCQLIQRNFYSWYKLNSEAQDQLWLLLENAGDLTQVRQWLLDRARNLSAETLGERQRYSSQFYKNLWKAVEKNKLFQPRGEKLLGFSPTLRDGSLFEDSPSTIEWIGFEPLSFELLFCEIRFLWAEPKSPPLWIKGSGLEMSMEQQGSLLLTHCGKQNVLKQMDSISCCEIAVIAEENLIRTQGRGLAAQALRKLVDQHGVLKKLKQPSTTRGMYQACQTLDKLREGGTLIWAREELLLEGSGKPSLQFLLNHAKILLIADLSGLRSDFGSIQQDLPKALYILKKESRLEERKSHRPVLVRAFGTLSRQEDLGILFDRIMSLSQKSDQVFPPEPFQLQARISPMDQREWEQHWFNPSDDDLVDQIEELKRNSTPLGQLAAVKLVASHSLMQSSTLEPNLFSEQSLEPGTGFYAWVESSKNGNEVFTAAANKLPHYMKSGHNLFWIAPLKAEWGDSLQTLVRSQLTRDWFNYSVERKKGAWLLKEGDLKSIPIPKHISTALMSAVDISTLPDRDASILAMIPNEPNTALQAIENRPELKPFAFILASGVLIQNEEHQGMLHSMVSPDEELVYSKFFQTVLGEKDLCALNQHPLIRFTPTLSPHQTISDIAVLKFPTPGILFTTSKGLTQTLYIQDSWLRERCFKLIEELRKEISDPTWSELSSRIRLPRNPDHAQAMSIQILKAYSNEKLRKKELNHLVSVCLHARKNNSEKIGLLQ